MTYCVEFSRDNSWSKNPAGTSRLWQKEWMWNWRFMKRLFPKAALNMSPTEKKPSLNLHIAAIRLEVLRKIMIKWQFLTHHADWRLLDNQTSNLLCVWSGKTRTACRKRGLFGVEWTRSKMWAKRFVTKIGGRFSCYLSAVSLSGSTVIYVSVYFNCIRFVNKKLFSAQNDLFTRGIFAVLMFFSRKTLMYCWHWIYNNYFPCSQIRLVFEISLCQ